MPKLLGQKSFDSVAAKPSLFGLRGLRAPEFVVYKSAQVRPRYLLAVEQVPKDSDRALGSVAEKRAYKARKAAEAKAAEAKAEAEAAAAAAAAAAAEAAAEAAPQAETSSAAAAGAAAEAEAEATAEAAAVRVWVRVSPNPTLTLTLTLTLALTRRGARTRRCASC